MNFLEWLGRLFTFSGKVVVETKAKKTPKKVAKKTKKVV